MRSKELVSLTPCENVEVSVLGIDLITADVCLYLVRRRCGRQEGSIIVFVHLYAQHIGVSPCIKREKLKFGSPHMV